MTIIVIVIEIIRPAKSGQYSLAVSEKGELPFHNMYKFVKHDSGRTFAYLLRAVLISPDLKILRSEKNQSQIYFDPV